MRTEDELAASAARESARLSALRGYSILDTGPEAAFDRLTALAADLFDAPIALVSLIDAERQWFKSRFGLDGAETPREHAFCDHVVAGDPHGVMVVEDATIDPRFAANPYVTGDPDVRFYAGAALTTPDGHNLGTLCVIDRQARPTPDAKQLARLKTLAGIVIDELELRRTARAMAQQQKMLDLAEDLSGVGCWRLTVPGPEGGARRVEWSAEVYRIYGVDPQTFDRQGETSLTFYTPESRARVRFLVAEALAGRPGSTERLEIIRPSDGAHRQLACRFACEHDETGRVSALVGVIQDVTDSEAALRAAQEQALRAEQAEAIAGLGHWRLEKGQVTWSPLMYDIYGFDPAQPLDMAAITATNHPDHAEESQARFARLLAGQGVEEALTRIIRPDGEERWLRTRATAERDAEGAVLALVGVVMDVTEQQQAQAELADSEARYRALAENTTDILVRFGRDGLIRYVSPACRSLGVDPDTAVGQSIVTLVAPDHLQHAEAIVADLFSGAEVDKGVRRHHRVLAQDGAEVWLEGSPKLVRDASGEVVEVVTVLRDITARKQAEEAAAEAQAITEQHIRQAELAEEIAGIGHWRLDRASRKLSWSPGIFPMYGLPPGETPDLAVAHAMLSPEDRAQADADAAHAIRTGESYRSRTSITRADGSVCHTDGRTICETDENGRVTALFGVRVDITERVEAEAALTASENRYRVVTEAARDLVIKYDTDGVIRYASKAARHFGYAPGDLIGVNCSDFIHPDDLETAQIQLSNLFGRRRGQDDNSNIAEIRVRHANGDWIWVEGNPSVVRDAAGRPFAFVNSLRDITTRKAMQAALAASEARYRGLADAAPDMICETALDHTVRYVSPACRAMFGVSPRELTNRNAFDHMPPDEAAAGRAACAAIVASKGKAVIEPVRYSARHTDGRQVWVESRPAAMFDPQTGEVCGFIDIIRDITARKALEDALEAAKAEAEAAAAVKGEFLANMSHELRTPLTAVLGFTRLALEQPELSETTASHIRKASGAGAALLTLVNDILDFSKLEAGRVEIRPRPASPADVCRESLGLFSEAAADKGLSLTFRPAPDLPAQLSFDAERVRQLLLNLVGNAVKFSDRGEIAVSAAWADGKLLVKVADNGPGLSGEQQAFLFQRFSQIDGSSTRRHGGTGLGLAISRGLTEAMGGAIGVDSAPGRGAVFHFEIPAPLSNAETAPQAPAPPLPDLPRGLRVLVADDRAANRELVRAILTAAGAVVSEAGDGLQAVAAAAEAPYDVILMDLTMPGLDGTGAMRAIRTGGRVNANVPILAFSASVNGDPVAASARLAAGFDGDVGKPISPAQMLGAIVRQLWPEDGDDDISIPDLSEGAFA